jgi:hypothetical protein
VTGAKGDPAAAEARHNGLRTELRALGLERHVASIRPMSGGYVADVWLVTYADREVAASYHGDTPYFGKPVTSVPVTHTPLPWT